jgi:predicted ATPase
MVHKVTLRHFKRFREDSFDIFDTIILAGPNNSGKSTLLQAIAAWNLARKKWLRERGPESGSRAKQRIGVTITRKDFTAIPLREMNLLWTDRSTALSKEELNQGQKLGTPRKLIIELRGKFPSKEWSLAFEFTYRYPDLIHVKPSNETPIEPILREINKFQVIHVPPFSGIGAEETGYDLAYQELLIGQGKPGDILRNLLLEVYREKQDEWSELCSVVREIFGYNLLPPEYNGRPFIVCEYQPMFSDKKVQPRLDISCAGSGFLQVLMLLGFFYARPASVLLLDEPDAHLHVILQKQIYDRLRTIARNRGCQLLIATHSEVLIDSTSPDRIVSFLDHPHKLFDDTQRDQVREALKRVTSLDMLLAEQSPGILYTEGETDLNLLREWARVFQHPTCDFFSKRPLFHSNQGSHPRESRSHYFALKVVKPNIRGVLILDRDNRDLPSHEVSAEGLTIIRWNRYEAENYLINPNVLFRFVRGVNPDLFTSASAERGLEYLKQHLPPAIFENPLIDDDYFRYTPASKTLLPGFFEAAGVPLTKNEYYQIAAQMNPDEIPTEVKEKLDAIFQGLGLSSNEPNRNNFW